MTDLRLRVDVPGKPRGQGSMTLWTDKDGRERAHYGDEVTRHRNLVVGTLVDAWAGKAALDEPVAVWIRASFARPANHYLPVNSKRTERVLRDCPPTFWTGFPDSDKIARLTNDSLTIAHVIRDDVLVVVCRVEKVFDLTSHTTIEVWTNPMTSRR